MEMHAPTTVHARLGSAATAVRAAAPRILTKEQTENLARVIPNAGVECVEHVAPRRMSVSLYLVPGKGALPIAIAKTTTVHTMY